MVEAVHIETECILEGGATCFHPLTRIKWEVCMQWNVVFLSLLTEQDGGRLTTVKATLGNADVTEEISYSGLRIVGSGSFGVVYQAKLGENGETVAIKKVLQDRRFKVCECEVGW